MKSKSKHLRLPQRLLQDVLAAIMLLSRVPINWEKVSVEAPDLRRAMWAYPVVGLFVGACTAGVLFLASISAMPTIVSVLLAITVGVLITGAFHEDGLADVADGFGGGHSKDKKLEIMRDSRIGTYGGLALILAIALKTSSLVSLPLILAAKALVIGAVVSRAMILVPAWVLKPARKNSLATEAGKPTALTLIAAFVFAVAIVYFAVGYWAGLWIFGSAFAVVFLFCRLAHTQVQGFSGDILGATQQLAEIAVFITLATLWQYPL